MKIRKSLLSLAIAAITLTTGLVGSLSANALPIGDSNQGVEDIVIELKTSIKNALITIEGSTSYVHTDDEIKPTVSVKRKNRQGEYSIVLTQDEDFEVTYEDNVAVGTATVTATGIGKYKDSVSTTFEITHYYDDVWTIDQPATNSSVGSKSHHCKVLNCTSKIDVTEIPKTSKLEGTVYYQNNTDKRMRFVAEVNESDVLAASSGSYSLSVDGNVEDTADILIAYKAIYANGELKYAPEGKCYIITNTYTGLLDGIEIKFALDIYNDPLTKVYNT